MRNRFWALTLILLVAFSCAAQQAVEPAPERQLTKEEKKAVETAEKERRKYPDWLVVMEVRGYTVAPQTFGYVGWCGGNLSWIFCVSGPLTTAGGQGAVLHVRLEIAGDENLVSCSSWTQGVIIYPGKYPARKRKFGLMDVLVNLDGKLKKVTCRQI